MSPFNPADSLVLSDSHTHTHTCTVDSCTYGVLKRDTCHFTISTTGQDALSALLGSSDLFAV